MPQVFSAGVINGTSRHHASRSLHDPAPDAEQTNRQPCASQGHGHGRPALPGTAGLGASLDFATAEWWLGPF